MRIRGIGAHGCARSREAVAPSLSKSTFHTIATFFTLRKATEGPVQEPEVYIYNRLITIYGRGRVLWAGQQAGGVTGRDWEPLPSLAAGFSTRPLDVITVPGERHPGQLASPGDTTCEWSYRVNANDGDHHSWLGTVKPRTTLQRGSFSGHAIGRRDPHHRSLPTNIV